MQKKKKTHFDIKSPFNHLKKNNSIQNKNLKLDPFFFKINEK
jgi:hypothetical protein